uniref:NB-ARC domain-containing protein n=1 Tax=Nelumbo nucifera TaxID=4432 RepID=A0A822YBW0_NELNU|nr:TPA_asm: hypothetical protein HUJ06_031260 [Nelumbo nucifera]
MKKNVGSCFKQRAFEQGHEPDPKLVEIGKEIVKKCKGVPLAAKSLGSLMRFKTQESEWLYVKNNEIWRIEGDDDNDDDGDGIVRVLRLSYDHLPSKLKQCFAYCAIFPKDHEIEKETLIQLWMAQGFIGGSSSSLEEIGEEYFNDLLWRSMFQEAKEDEEGNIVSCKMHDLVHDLAQSVAGAEYFRMIEARDEEVAQPPTITIPEGVRHVALLDPGRYKRTNGIEFWSQLKLSNKVPTLLSPRKSYYGMRLAILFWSQLKLSNKVRTLLLLPPNYYFGMRLPIERIMSCACLRVLHLHLSFIERLKISSIGELKHLRYLHLSLAPLIETLPASITKLQNLQTMKLINCSSLENLPKDTGNMKSLRHVDLSGNEEIKALPASITKLENLHTLNLDSCGPFENLPDNLGRLRKLRIINLTITAGEHVMRELHGLNLSGDLTIEGVEQVRDGKEANLKEKPHLRSLTLEYGGEGNNDDDALEGLRPHPSLKELKLKGYGGMKFASWMIKSSLLPNLVRIQLRDCPRCESLEFSGPLPSLEYLSLSELISLKSITSKLRKGEGFFPSLKELYLFHLPKLESWSVVMAILDGDQEVVVVEEEEPHNSLSVVLFPHLPNRWIIEGCPKLESIPWGWPARERVDLCLIDAKALELVLKKKDEEG